MPALAAALPSAFAPLRQRPFRLLWLVWLGANLTLLMNDVACAWLMTSLTDNALMVAMVQSAATLPLFLLGLPSGALADRFDRRRYLALTEVWVGAVAIALAALSLSGARSVTLLLACTFLNGVGVAMRWPLFAAIVPDLVQRGDLPAALTLNGIAGNVSRIIAPIIAGALLAAGAGAYVFVVNAALSVLALILILRWQPAPTGQQGRREPFVAAMGAGLRFVLRSAPLRIILLRISLLFLQSTALIALLPLVALRLGGAGPATFTCLLVALACGAILIAFNLNRLRARVSRARIVGAGICVHAAASTCAALAPSLWLAMPAVAVAGMAWLASANALTVAMQLALPNWVRARAMAIYHMAVMGGSAIGAALWGCLASVSSVPLSIATAALLGPVVFWLTRGHGVGEGEAVDSAEAR